MKVIYKYFIPIDDQIHPFPLGDVVLVAGAVGLGNTCTVWIEQDPEEKRSQGLIVVGTGHPIQEEFEHVGSWQGQYLVWHIYRV